MSTGQKYWEDMDPEEYNRRISKHSTSDHNSVEHMTREDFFEKLDDFDFDSFGKDDNFDNSDVYQVVQFFANRIFDKLEANKKEGA